MAKPRGPPAPPVSHGGAADTLGRTLPVKEPEHDASAKEDELPAASKLRTSRICVKGLPKYVDEKRLREHFGAKGEVTDVKVLRSRDGVSRQLAFVGFKTEGDAEAAQKYFDRSYMDTGRLTVELAFKYGDSAASRPWSKYSQGSSAFAKKVAASPDGLKAAAAHKASQEPTVVIAAEDPKLAEFMALMQPRSKARTWGNDELAAAGAAAQAKGPATRRKGDAAKKRAAGGAAEDLHPSEPGRAGRKSAAVSKEEDGEQDGAEEEGEEEDDGEYQEIDHAACVRGASALLGRAEDDDDEEEEDEEEDVDGGGGARGFKQGGRGARDNEASGSDDEEVDDVGVGGSGIGTVTVAAMSDLDYLRSRMAKWDDEDDEYDGQGGAGAAGGRDDLQVGVTPVIAVAADAAAAKARSRGGSSDAAAAHAVALDAAAARADQSGVGTSPRCDDDDAGGEHQLVAAAAMAAADGDQMDVDVAAGQTGAGDEGAKWRGGGTAADEGGATEVEPISETGRLFVRNLPYGAGEADLRAVFEPFGEVAELHLVRERGSGRSKGLAYVLYTAPKDAVAAAEQLDMSSFQGRLMHILPAQRARGGANAAAGSSGHQIIEVEGGADAADVGPDGVAAAGGAKQPSFKTQRDAQRKADAGNRVAWNTLFVRQDTVAEAVAAHYGVSKSELLDPSAPDMAVRMALGEAAVIAQTKAALAEQGVAVEVLETAAAASGHSSAPGAGSAVQRSRTTLMAKNLPYSVEEDELQSLFGRAGPLSRLVLPPSHALAIVEYIDPADARTAFKMMAYKKIHNVPLYLEWAPRDVFCEAAEHSARKASGSSAAAAAAPEAAAGTGATVKLATLPSKARDVRDASKLLVAAAQSAGDAAAEGEGSAANATSIFVKNLHFDTTDAGLKRHFEKAVVAAGGLVHSAKVVRKKADPKAPKKVPVNGGGGADSMGYGFVDCGTAPAARAAMQRLQGSMLDGHRLLLQLSLRTGGTTGGAGGSTAAAGGTRRAPDAGPGGGGGEGAAGSCRVLVRNMAFEATRSDVMGLFGAFGSIKSCRLPRKFDGTPRGFAFVDFATKQEAAAAMEGVAGAHLYGRRLKMEYAADQERPGGDHNDDGNGGGKAAGAAAARGDGYAAGVAADRVASGKVAAARAKASQDLGGRKRKDTTGAAAAPKKLKHL